MFKFKEQVLTTLIPAETKVSATDAFINVQLHPVSKNACNFILLIDIVITGRFDSSKVSAGAFSFFHYNA